MKAKPANALYNTNKRSFWLQLHIVSPGPSYNGDNHLIRNWA